ncbi:hypothetical protein GCM10027194_31250 [Thalassiella azotivora]
MDAAVRLTSREGVRAVTARAVAAEADVNQALVFYHFDGVEGLLREAFDDATTRMVGRYVAELDEVRSFADLHALGVRLSADSRADGSAALLSHVVAASHTDPAVAAVLTAQLDKWRAALSATLQRVLRTHRLDDALDVGSLTSSLAAASIGMITLDAVPGQPLGSTLPSLGRLARLTDRAARLLPAPLVRRLLTDRP